jgi:hemolysin activation/secretion protein
VSDRTPFFLACSLGGSDAFRGYPSTENIGDSLASFQLALRGNLVWRFGYAVFAGVGNVADDFSAIGKAEPLAAGGLGVRFRVSRKYPVDFSVDVAVNRQEETTTYIYVGQRF